MSCKSALSNSVKSNSEPPQWVKSQSSTETNVKLAGEEAKDRLYEPKHNKKVVRVLTVVAYIFFVSLAAIMLSLYYIFIWNPHPKVKLASDAVNIGKSRYNCPDILNQEALAQIKADVSSMSLETQSPNDVESVLSSMHSTTEDSVESIYDEASSETKIIDNNIESSMLSYESDNLSNETTYK